jgi:hypothetical protein
MMWMFGKTFRLVSLVAVFLVVWNAFSSFSAVAQGRHMAPAANAADSAKSKETMKFDVVSIKRSKPGTNWAQGPGLLPNGYQNRGLNLG